MLRVLVFGADLQGEQSVLRRLCTIEPGAQGQMRLSQDFGSSDLVVVRGNAGLCNAVRRIARSHTGVALWALDDDGLLSDAQHDPPRPMDEGAVRRVLSGLLRPVPPPVAAVQAADADPGDLPALFEGLRRGLAAGDGFAALQLDGRSAILVDFRRRLLLAPLSAHNDQVLELPQGTTFQRLRLRTLPARQVALHVGQHGLPLVPALWQAALRMQVAPVLVAPLHEDTRMALLRWPDFRVVAHRPDDFRLCSLLLKRACTAGEAGQVLAIDAGSVRAFFNAAWLTGYAHEQAGGAAPLKPPSRSAPGSLLASLWRGIRGQGKQHA